MIKVGSKCNTSFLLNYYIVGQSPVLRYVNLSISRLDNQEGDLYFFGTHVIENDEGVPMDPCSGDSGKLLQLKQYQTVYDFLRGSSDLYQEK